MQTWTPNARRTARPQLRLDAAGRQLAELGTQFSAELERAREQVAIVQERAEASEHYALRELDQESTLLRPCLDSSTTRPVRSRCPSRSSTNWTLHLAGSFASLRSRIVGSASVVLWLPGSPWHMPAGLHIPIRCRRRANVVTWQPHGSGNSRRTCLLRTPRFMRDVRTAPSTRTARRGASMPSCCRGASEGFTIRRGSSTSIPSGWSLCLHHSWPRERAVGLSIIFCIARKKAWRDAHRRIASPTQRPR